MEREGVSQFERSEHLLILVIFRNIQEGCPELCGNTEEAHRDYLATLCRWESYREMIVMLPKCPVYFLPNFFYYIAEFGYQDITRAVPRDPRGPAWASWKNRRCGLPLYFYSDDGLNELVVWLNTKPYKGFNVDEVTHMGGVEHVLLALGLAYFETKAVSKMQEEDLPEQSSEDLRSGELLRFLQEYMDQMSDYLRRAVKVTSGLKFPENWAIMDARSTAEEKAEEKRILREKELERKKRLDDKGEGSSRQRQKRQRTPEPIDLDEDIEVVQSPR